MLQGYLDASSSHMGLPFHHSVVVAVVGGGGGTEKQTKCTVQMRYKAPVRASFISK